MAETNQLGECVKQLLCGLNYAAQTAIRSAIGVLVLQIETQIAALNAYLLYLNILTAPLNLINASVKQAANEIKSLSGIFPVAFLVSCLDLGELSAKINLTIDTEIAFIDRVINETNRYLSLKDEVEAIIADLQAALDTLKQVDLIIGACENDRNT